MPKINVGVGRSNAVKVRVGQQPATKILTTGTTGGSGAGKSLESLSDTFIENKLDGQFLLYDGVSGRWINSFNASELIVDGGVY